MTDPRDPEPLADTSPVVCPYCFEMIEIYVDPEVAGELVQDCEVCCNPWQLTVRRSRHKGLTVYAERLQ